MGKDHIMGGKTSYNGGNHIIKWEKILYRHLYILYLFISSLRSNSFLNTQFQFSKELVVINFIFTLSERNALFLKNSSHRLLKYSKKGL